MSRELNDALDKVIEDVDALISVDITEPELFHMLKSYKTKDETQALAMVNGAVKRLLFTKYNHSLERVFFDPIYWQYFSRARRADILQELHTFVMEEIQ